jgi:hypothetical protein
MWLTGAITYGPLVTWSPDSDVVVTVVPVGGQNGKPEPFTTPWNTLQTIQERSTVQVPIHRHWAICAGIFYNQHATCFSHTRQIYGATIGEDTYSIGSRAGLGMLQTGLPVAV